MTPIYGNVNKFKTKEERLYVLSAYRKKLLEIPKAGFNPFEDNTDLYNKYKSEVGAKVDEQTIEVKEFDKVLIDLIQMSNNDRHHRLFSFCEPSITNKNFDYQVLEDYLLGSSIGNIEFEKHK